MASSTETAQLIGKVSTKLFRLIHCNVSEKYIHFFVCYLFTFYQLWRISIVISGGATVALLVNRALLKFPWERGRSCVTQKSQQKQTIRKSKCNNKHSPLLLLLLLLLCREVIINSGCSVMMIIMIIAVCEGTTPYTACNMSGHGLQALFCGYLFFFFFAFSWGFG